jgi:hypothetical protein
VFAERGYFECRASSRDVSREHLSHSDRVSERESERQRERNSLSEKDIERDAETERQRDRETERQRERESRSGMGISGGTWTLLRAWPWPSVMPNGFREGGSKSRVEQTALAPACWATQVGRLPELWDLGGHSHVAKSKF